MGDPKRAYKTIRGFRQLTALREIVTALGVIIARIAHYIV